MRRGAMKLSLLLWGELCSLPASVLGGVYGGFSPSAEISVERERVVREIARIGGSREMVSRILGDLADGGYIAVEGKRIILLRKLPPRW